MTAGQAHTLSERARPPAGADAAVCVFAVCRTDSFGALPPGSGHPEGDAVRLLALDDALSAVVQDVPSNRFAEEALKQRLADPVELESCARAHHATVTAAAERGPVVPLPLATLFTGADRARAALSRQLPQFHEALTRVEGRAEWAVKVYARQTGTGDAPLVPNDGPGADVGAGRAYLTRVRGRERDRVARHEAAVAAAARIHGAASEVAVECVQRRPHGPEITGKDRHQLMNAAYLVAHERAGELGAALRAARAEVTATDVEVEVSGPWVPYSFTEPATALGVESAPAGRRT